MKLEIIVLVVIALIAAIFVYQSTSGEHEWAGRTINRRRSSMN